MKTMISSKGQIVLPAELRQQDGIRPGQQFQVERVASGHYMLKKLATPGKTDVLDWLRACPDQDWFRPLPSESTSEI
jgi:AbrB family looped-hinge helix DNA binding protein